jgi:hypothetical protein
MHSAWPPVASDWPLSFEPTPDPALTNPSACVSSQVWTKAQQMEDYAEKLDDELLCRVAQRMKYEFECLGYDISRWCKSGAPSGRDSGGGERAPSTPAHSPAISCSTP